MDDLYVELKEIVHCLTDSHNQTKVMEYTSKIGIEMKALEQQIEELRRIKALLKKKLDLVYQLFGEEDNPLISIQDVLTFVKDLNHACTSNVRSGFKV